MLCIVSVSIFFVSVVATSDPTPEIFTIFYVQLQPTIHFRVRVGHPRREPKIFTNPNPSLANSGQPPAPLPPKHPPTCLYLANPGQWSPRRNPNWPQQLRPPLWPNTTRPPPSSPSSPPSRLPAFAIMPPPLGCHFPPPTPRLSPTPSLRPLATTNHY